MRHRTTYRSLTYGDRRIGHSESIAPVFDSLLRESDRAAHHKGARLRGFTVTDRVALGIALRKIAAQQSRVGEFCLEWCYFRRPIVTVDLAKTVQSVKVLEALVRLCLDEVIVTVDAKTLTLMQKDRTSLLKRIRGGNAVLIIASSSRFYLRLFSVTKNDPLRRSIFAALRGIKIRSPYLLDMIDRSALDTATDLMLAAARAHDIVRARDAFDVLLGNGPLAHDPTSSAQPW